LLLLLLPSKYFNLRGSSWELEKISHWGIS